jgi:hypothetical protein
MFILFYRKMDATVACACLDTSGAVSAMTDAGILSAGYMKVAIIPKVGAVYNETPMGVGANNHNSIKSHIVSADILAQTLHDNWGFTPLYQNITFEDYESVLQKF